MADARFRVPEGVLCETLGQEAVLLNLETGTYFGLNATGAHAWQELVASGDPDAARAAVCAAFAVEDAQARRDLDALVADLEAHGLLARLE